MLAGNFDANVGRIDPVALDENPHSPIHINASRAAFPSISWVVLRVNVIDRVTTHHAIPCPIVGSVKRDPLKTDQVYAKDPHKPERYDGEYEPVPGLCRHGRHLAFLESGHDRPKGSALPSWSVSSWPGTVFLSLGTGRASRPCGTYGCTAHAVRGSSVGCRYGGDDARVERTPIVQGDFSLDTSVKLVSH